MRHSPIETAMKCYVGSEAEETVRLLHVVMAFDDHTARTDRNSVDTSVDTMPDESSVNDKTLTATDCAARV